MPRAPVEPAADAAPAASVTSTVSPAKTLARKINPYVLGYLMGPTALVLILILRSVGGVSRTPVWMWLAVFTLIPAASLMADQLCRVRPSTAAIQTRVAVHVASVTIAVYLTGWGPVLIPAFAFVALENLAHDGSRTWRITMGWSMGAIAIAQVGVLLHWVPSFLSTPQASALGLMGAFLLVFIIRMAGAAWEQKENAEQTTRASEERFRSLVQRSSDTTLVIGEGRDITYASPATHVLFGRAPDEVVGGDALDLVYHDDRERVALELASRLDTSSTGESVEFRVIHRDGTLRAVEAVLSDLRDRPSISGFVANLRDTTDRKAAEALIEHQALHDPLTGLANRTLILDRAEQMLMRADRALHSVAALFIDIDDFKEINDSCGHDAGDRMLRAIADRFIATARTSDTVGRLGGDEFVILADGLSLDAGPELLAERIRDVLREPFRIDGLASAPRAITASIGIADGVRGSAAELLRDADIALYQAKASGKNCWAVFEPDMESAVLDHLTLKTDLLSALDRDEFFLLYQPTFELDTRTVYGVEALLRWRHPTRGVIGPDEFIPVLEEMGLIVEVGRWVIDEACRRTAEWHRRGHPLIMSVNVSMRQVEDPALLDHVRDALVRNDLDPATLLLEITESALMRDAEQTIDRLRHLKALGVDIAIDDFGTGYSSLSYLREFPVDALKIDRSFIAGLSSSSESAALIHAMIEIGRALGLGTIAEGIEDDFQLQQLRRQGCRHGQGYLLSRPIPADEVDSMLHVPRESPVQSYRSSATAR